VNAEVPRLALSGTSSNKEKEAPAKGVSESGTFGGPGVRGSRSSLSPRKEKLMTEYTATAVRANTEVRGSARIGVTDLEIPGPVFPTEVSPAGETLRGEDALVRTPKSRGHAVPVGRTLEELDAGLLARVHALSERGAAHLYAEGGGIVLATAGSTAGDRKRAVESLPKIPSRPLATRRFFGILLDARAEGHYSEEDGWGLSRHDRPAIDAVLDATAERFKAARYYRPALPGIGLDAGAARRRANPAPRALLAAVLRTEPGEAVALLVLARFAVALLRRRLLRAGAPWDSEAERRRMAANGKRVRREILARRKSGRALVVKPARELDAERQAGCEPHWTKDERFTRRLERRRESGRAAYDTARALYLQFCPGLEQKLLHLLRRDGPKPEAEFLSRHRALAEGVSNPEDAARAALERLHEAGKVRRVKSRKTGEVFLAAAEPLDESRHRRALGRLIRDERFGIVNPWSATRGVPAEGDEAEWRDEGLDDFDEAGPRDLAPGRFRAAAEQPLHAAENVADEAALAEVEAIA
jgi:hypothetical protein